ncbi:2-oxoacid:ferredoxin oxidoreductase subunit beta [Cellulosilyticum sp. I15G10I2]|uniref:2-oxoacid:ferredoxin oxidoreductase subunit beta n=1 Tax=Cellulosilyticum sp. I15G10I2 TaxID=1892843 RepID=UPI00085C21F6|nr:2-oxoacid:ferredoxin oxidoreductase subunit beta [Cellulosilyticum sp. I15G10I2]
MLDIKIYDSQDEVSWCPGCGNHSILPALKQTLAELELKPHQVVIVSGIGQAAKTPHYINANGFNGLHGRAVPPAQGIKIANKDLKVIIHSGDGDTYGEGGNHLIHGVRRNVDITHVVHLNQIYGLTKGQASPTTAKGQKTSMQFDGNKMEPLQTLLLAIAAGCGFVARSFSGDKEHLVNILKEAINYKGYALIDVLQPCVVFNHINNFRWYKDRVYRLDTSDYDPTNKIEAMKKAMEWGDHGIPIGVLYREEKDTFMDKISYLKEGDALVDRKWEPKEAEKYMEDFR